MSYTSLILQAGYLIGFVLIFAIIFAESGIIIGFFLPGDSFLFTLGLLASQGRLDILLLLVVASAAAILGDSVGYATGRRFGPALFNRPNSHLFKKENLEKAHEFYEQYGKKTIVLARFVPFVRCFAPIIAGIAEMPYKTFLFYNVIGGLLWVFSISLAGYTLGSAVPNIDHYILPIVGLIIVASLLPTLGHLGNQKRKKNKGQTNG
ncbi:MAG: VTT domain-containing protein [bacterium]